MHMHMLVRMLTRGLLSADEHAGGGLQVGDGRALRQELGVAQHLRGSEKGYNSKEYELKRQGPVPGPVTLCGLPAYLELVLRGGGQHALHGVSGAHGHGGLLDLQEGRQLGREGRVANRRKGWICQYRTLEGR